MENVFIYFIIFLMLASFILEQFFDFRCWIKKSKVKPLKEEDITGYSCVDFVLSDTKKECDESIDVRNEIEVGQVLTCMIVPSRYNNEVSVNVKWFEVGLVSGKEGKIVYDRIFSGNYVSCFVYKKEISETGKDILKCRFVYHDSKGVYDFITDFTSLKNEDGDFEKIDISNYLVLSFTGEIVYRFRDDYVNDKEGLYPKKIIQDAIDEDDYFFKRFIIDLLRGFIVNKQDKSDFMRECGKERLYGNNKILRKRITNYLTSSGVYLVD